MASNASAARLPHQQLHQHKCGTSSTNNRDTTTQTTQAPSQPRNQKINVRQKPNEATAVSPTFTTMPTQSQPAVSCCAPPQPHCQPQLGAIVALTVALSAIVAQPSQTTQWPEKTVGCAKQTKGLLRQPSYADALTACLLPTPTPPRLPASANNASAARLPDAIAASKVALSRWSPHTYKLPPRATGLLKFVGGLWLG